MKIRKSFIWLGIILCALLAGFILVTPVRDSLAIIPEVGFILLVISLMKKGDKKKAKKTEATEDEEDEEAEDDEENEEPAKKNIDWPLVICWSLVGLTAISTILVLIFFGWWFLLPLAALFGTMIWLAYLLNWNVIWICLFATFITIAIILLGVFGIVASNRGNINDGVVDTLNVNKLVVNEATIGKEDVQEQNVGMQKVENSDTTNQTVQNQTVTNQVTQSETVTNQVVENQTVTNQTVTNQTVENQTVTNQTVEKPTETKPTEPDTTEPTPTEPKPTEPVHKHNYTAVVTEPTCMEQGYTTHTCECGDSYKDSYKGALGHSYKSNVVAPTTEAEGYTEHKCERCGHTYKDTFVDRLPKPNAPAIKCANTIRYGETLYVNLEGIGASNLKVSNKAFVSVETLSDSRVALTLTEDVTGYLTITDSVSGTNVVIDIAEA